MATSSIFRPAGSQFFEAVTHERKLPREARRMKVKFTVKICVVNTMDTNHKKHTIGKTSRFSSYTQRRLNNPSSVRWSVRKLQMSVKRGCPWRCSKINNEDSLDSTRFLDVLASINPQMGHRCTQGRPGSINQSSNRRFMVEKSNIDLSHLHVCHLEDQVR